jgi:hypothetical protein
MSLSDALLLDPHRDPREIWIALRKDGQRGRGTIDDPYNGSAISSTVHPTRVIQSLTASGTTASATTDGPHGFATGDLVTIGGVDIQLANVGNGNASDNDYVGTFAVNVPEPDTDTFTYTMPNPPHNSTAPVPSGGSIRCWRERELFDVVMRGVPENAVIHLGPGVFETKGRSEIQAAIDGWQPKSGQRFLGSSMGLTTLKLVNASGVGWRKYYAILATNVNGFEVADLTVDCNVDGQLSPLTNCAAIAVTSVARHVRIRRVRVINFGSNGPLGAPLEPDFAYSENFPIFVGGTDVVDVVYEDCVAEQPAPNVVWNSTILQAAGGYDGKVYYGRGLVLRNNYVNGQLVYGPRAYVESLAVDAGNVWKLTTKTPHGYKVPGNVSVQGVKVNGNTNNRFNGVFKIDQIVSDTELKYTVFDTDPDLGEVSGNPTVDADTIIGAPVSPHPVRIGAVSVAEDNQTFTIKTISPYPPHNLTVNNRTWIQGIELNGFDPGDPYPDDPLVPKTLPVNHADNPCNGLFRVINVISKTQFQYVAKQPIDDEVIAPDPDVENDAYTFSGEYMSIGAGHHFIGSAACTGAVQEGNRLLHGDKGAPWNDTASTLDLVARNNYYHDVNIGAYRNMGHEIVAKAASSLARDGLIATCNVGTQEHGLVLGQVVHITNTHFGGFPEPLPERFNGYHVVTELGVALDGTAFFKYQMTAVPTQDADTSPPPLFRPASQDGNLILENNVIELALGRLQGYWSNPSGIQFVISNEQIPYAFRQVLLRENVIRQIDGQADFSHFGIIVRNSEKLQVVDNVIDVGGGGVRFKRSVAPSFSSNVSPAGQLLRGYNEATGESQSELATKIEDALIFSL